MQRNLFATASLALILGTLPAPAIAAQAEPEAPTSYVCGNGMSLNVIYLSVRGHEAIEIQFPNGRETGVNASLLLPSTQTGSGVRYASDITELHVKGDTARFSTAASAQSEAIAPLECWRAVEEDAEAPITQEAAAGQYFIETGHTPAYFRAEVICFAPDARGFFGMNRASGANRAVTYNGRSARESSVSPVDAGAGQRRYTLNLIEDPDQELTLHFIAPGMREAEQPSATAGLSSISQKGEHISCVDNDNLVYIGVGPTFGVAITAEKDGLALRTFGEYKDPVWQDMREGYATTEDGLTAFHFFNGDTQIRIEADHNGMPGVDQSSIPIARDWSLSSVIANRNEVPKAYFIADASVLAKFAPELSARTSQLLQSLSICNHLAGEASDNAERNAQLGEMADKAKCDAVPNLYAEAVKNAPEGSGLKQYLKKNSPNWM